MPKVIWLFIKMLGPVFVPPSPPNLLLPLFPSPWKRVERILGLFPATGGDAYLVPRLKLCRVSTLLPPNSCSSYAQSPQTSTAACTSSNWKVSCAAVRLSQRPHLAHSTITSGPQRQYQVSIPASFLVYSMHSDGKTKPRTL